MEKKVIFIVYLAHLPKLTTLVPLQKSKGILPNRCLARRKALIWECKHKTYTILLYIWCKVWKLMFPMLTGMPHLLGCMCSDFWLFHNNRYVCIYAVCRSRLKAAKLQRVWQKVCENEKRSKARNQQLLSDYQRVEAHVAALSTRTERLRLLKVLVLANVTTYVCMWNKQKKYTP